MRTSLIFALLIGMLFTDDDLKMNELRDLYERAPVSETANLKLNKFLETKQSNNALINGYKGAGTMILANHVFNPITKLSKFNKGKKLIERAIKDEPNNIELRYIRFTIQTNLPGFLGYKGNIKSDKVFLINGLSGLADTDLRDRIVDYLIKPGVCTVDELKKVSLWKNK
ncbi:MAG: hypothetical protein EOP00_26035 [Pedobacter sp.]|nr:MAG: hypothetical protein EOP00_26035 [Pedobacter sp.]